MREKKWEMFQVGNVSQESCAEKRPCSFVELYGTFPTTSRVRFCRHFNNNE